jgi:hypothetical protein
MAENRSAAGIRDAALAFDGSRPADFKPSPCRIDVNESGSVHHFQLDTCETENGVTTRHSTR